MVTREFPDRFLVAFSFAGEERKLVRKVAIAVEKQLGESSVFFDEWFEYYIAGNDADTTLQEIYADQSDLVVVCVSESYGQKEWTRTEHETIRSRLMKGRDRKDILPIRVGDGDVPGVHFNTIAPDIRSKTIAESAQLIIDRLRLVNSSPLPSIDPPGRSRPWNLRRLGFSAFVVALIGYFSTSGTNKPDPRDVASLRELSVRFKSAAAKYPDASFRYDVLTGSREFHGGREWSTTYRELATASLKHVPAEYLSSDGLLDTKLPPEELWSLGVIATKWRLGNPKKPMFFIQSRKDSETNGAWMANAFKMSSPFRFEETDVADQVTALWEKKGGTIESIAARHFISCFQDSADAIDQLLMRADLPAGVDNLAPSYTNAVLLMWDLDDFSAAVKKCGTDYVEHQVAEAGFALSAGTVPLRLGLTSFDAEINDFNPRLSGWGYRGHSAFAAVIPAVRECRKAIQDDLKHFPIPLDYSRYATVAPELISRVDSVRDEIRTVLREFRAADAQGASNFTSVAEVIGMDSGNRPLTPRNEIVGEVQMVIERFKSDVENAGASSLLWADSQPLGERQAQQLFYTMARPLSESLDIDLSREPNAGRGAVDFKFSRGNERALAEFKVASGWSSLRRGLTRQLPQYQKSEYASRAFFVVICFDDSQLGHASRLSPPDSIDVVIIDARRKPSASKL